MYLPPPPDPEEEEPEKRTTRGFELCVLYIVYIAHNRSSFSLVGVNPLLSPPPPKTNKQTNKTRQTEVRTNQL